MIQKFIIQEGDSIFQILNMINPLFKIIIFLIALHIGLAASFQPLDSLIQEKFSDQAQVIRLANDEKFSIPLNGRYISYSIKYHPENANDCQFKQPSVEYKKLAQSSKLFEEDDEVIASLVLKKNQKIILADPYFNIAIYSTDQHTLLRLLSPKTSLLSSSTRKRKMVSNLAMITTEEEEFVYYLSPEDSFVFSSRSFGTQTQKLNVKFPSIQKAIYYESHIIVLTAEEGVYVYKLNKTSHSIEKVQTIKNKQNHQFIDIELDFDNQLFYVLTQSSIEVYLFEPSNFPNPSDQRELLILKSQDEISLFNHTRNHASRVIENNQHLNLQISSTNGETQLFVLFRHSRQNVIAEFSYDPIKKEVTFLRYFKFQMQIKEIHTIKDVIVVVGEDILGMFPYGIDPRLITEEFNGWMTLSDIEKIAITEAPYFVGITKNSIQYGGLLFSKSVGLSCQFNESSLTKSISFQGNLTQCSKDQTHSYNEYCSYSKKFILESMDIVTTSTVSFTVWVVILVCTAAIIFGILIILIMQKRKNEEIQKIELYFDQRRRTQIPASSDRRGTEDKM